MLKNIIFDIGGVLLEYNLKTYLDKLNIEEPKRKEINDISFPICSNNTGNIKEIVKWRNNERNNNREYF